MDGSDDICELSSGGFGDFTALVREVEDLFWSEFFAVPFFFSRLEVLRSTAVSLDRPDGDLVNLEVRELACDGVDKLLLLAASPDRPLIEECFDLLGFLSSF